MVFDELDRFRAVRSRLGKRLELEPEAFGGIARSHAGGFHILQATQRDRDLIGVEFEFRRKKLQQLFERGLQVSVVVERIDQRRDDLPVAQRKVAQRELRVQVVAQRAGGDLLRRKAFIVVIARRRSPVAVAARGRHQIEVAAAGVFAALGRRFGSGGGRGDRLPRPPSPAGGFPEAGARPPH